MAQDTLGAGIDTISGVEHLTGSAFDDILTGSSGNNTIDGGAGNDLLNGGAGNDNLQGGLGDDVLIGGTGNDILNGGAGIDTADYSGSSAGVTVGVTQQGSLTASGGDAQGDSVSGTIENLIGSAFNDTLVGDAVAGSVTDNRLDGGAGNDTLQGGAGNDVLIGGAGNDSLNGGAGIDTADYSGSSAGVTVGVTQQGSLLRAVAMRRATASPGRSRT